DPDVAREIAETELGQDGPGEAQREQDETQGDQPLCHGICHHYCGLFHAAFQKRPRRTRALRLRAAASCYSRTGERLGKGRIAMPFVAMTREMGSLGKDVATGLAERLGRQVVHHEIIDNLASKMRLRKSHVVRFLEGKAGIWERLTTDKTSLSIYTAD